MHCLARTAVEGEGLGVLGNLLIRSVGSRIRDPAGLAARACKEEVVCVQKERGASDGQDVAVFVGKLESESHLCGLLCARNENGVVDGIVLL